MLSEQYPYRSQFCSGCWNRLQSNFSNCPRCSATIHPAALENPLIHAGCPSCRSIQFHFQKAISVGPYKDAWREVVLRIKNSLEDSLAIELGRTLGAKIVDSKFAYECDLIAPISTFWKSRLFKRGHLASVLATGVGQVLGKRVAVDFLVTTRKTQKQGMLSSTERRRNVRGAFCVSQKYQLNKAKILLIDDVLTSGATASEAAKACLKAGASSVNVAVVARGAAN